MKFNYVEQFEIPPSLRFVSFGWQGTWPDGRSSTPGERRLFEITKIHLTIFNLFPFAFHYLLLIFFYEKTAYCFISIVFPDSCSTI